MDDTLKNETYSSWIKLLNPKLLKQNLIKASVYIAFFEQLQNSIIERIKDFYICGYRDGKDIIEIEYKTRFHKKGVNILDESLNWLIEHKAITLKEKADIINLKDHRNELAHEMFNFVASADKDVRDDLLVSCYNILSKIDKWWIIEVEIPTNSDFENIDPSTIDYDGIASMNMILLKLLYKVYSGNDKELEEIYTEFMKKNDNR